MLSISLTMNTWFEQTLLSDKMLNLWRW
ncbi:hypothetical protein ACNKHT_09800 [Shigella flexneri]